MNSAPIGIRKRCKVCLGKHVIYYHGKKVGNGLAWHQLDHGMVDFVLEVWHSPTGERMPCEWIKEPCNGCDGYYKVFAISKNQVMGLLCDECTDAAASAHNTKTRPAS